MATDWAARVKKDTPDADDAVIATMLRMKDGTRNTRNAAYHLLAEKFVKLDVFRS